MKKGKEPRNFRPGALVVVQGTDLYTHFVQDDIELRRAPKEGVEPTHEWILLDDAHWGGRVLCVVLAHVVDRYATGNVLCLLMEDGTVTFTRTNYGIREA